MADERNARTYAHAIFEKAVEGWMTPLKAIHASIVTENLAGRLDDAGMAFVQKQELLARVVPAHTAIQVQNLVALLASKNDTHLLPDVIAEFERYAKRGAERPLAHVTSAVGLQADEKKALEAKLQKQFGADVEYEYGVDASILGGVVVRVGDRVIDASIAGKLAALKEKLTS